MSVEAYITAGANVIPVLPPDALMVDVARQIGIPQDELFRVDVPSGMTRHTSAKVLIASTQVANLFAVGTVSLTLADSSGSTVTLSNLYARPPQPFLWREPGGPVLVELVDQRWYWQFASGAVNTQALAPLWSSDGRWQLNLTSGGPNPVTSYADLLNIIGTAATSINLTAPTGFTTRSPEYLRRLSDLVGSPNASMALLIDAIAVANRQLVISTGSGTAFIEINTLKAQYDARMNAQRKAMAGGMAPVNGAAGGTDPLVNLYNQAGYTATAPSSASVIMPRRSVEGLTIYDNVTVANTPATQQHFAMKGVLNAGSAASWTRSPANVGRASLTEGAVVVNDSTGGTLSTAPGWSTTAFVTSVRADYASRYSNTPFGRTVWAGWVGYYTSVTDTIGQVGTVSYRLAMINGQLAPFTVTECDETDWRLGLQGASETDPSELVVGKGKAQAYRNCVGATIIDVPPPNTRVFPAKITAADPCNSEWKWLYTFEEVEPNPDPTDCTPWVSVGLYGRTGTSARNMAEAGNVYLGAGNAGNVIAPGVLQSAYPLAAISALPISVGTVVDMVEQVITVYEGFPTAPYGPQYWFSMPNAVLVECAEG